MTSAHASSDHDSTTLRNRERMLAKVKRFWITGVLEESLSGAMQLQVQMKYDPQAVAPAWEVIHRAHTGDRYVPGDATIADVFDEASGELLILGGPGSGKTIMLLELAQALIARAEQKADLPIPVVFNLSSWAEKSLSLDSWLVEELNLRYQVPRKIGKQWIDSDGLAFLLDGLDEVDSARRGACVEAINDFRQEHGFTPMVICSRSDDYAALKAHSTLQVAVVLQPLLPAQIEAALAAGGKPFDTVRAILEEDAKLRELITSPLMLNILLMAYGEQSDGELLRFDSLEDRRRHLFERYVERMLSHRGGTARYSTAQVKQHLGWLARYMSRRAQMIFSLEALQPDALPSRGRFVHTLTISLIMSLSFGLVVGTTIWLVSSSWWGMRAAPVDAVAGGLAFAIAINVAYWRTRGGAFGIALGNAAGLAVGVPTALMTGIASGVSTWLGVALVSSLVGWFSFGPSRHGVRQQRYDQRSRDLKLVVEPCRQSLCRPFGRLCDWRCDDLPAPVHVRRNRLLPLHLQPA